MGDGVSESLFAFRRSHTGKGPFATGRRLVEVGMVEAESVEAARDQIIGRSSIAAVKDGLTVEIVPVDLSTAQVFYAQYERDFDPFEPGPPVKLLVGPLL